jgi:thymidylate synthase ThyX
MNNLISAKLIEKTESAFGDVLVTIETTSPKFLDAEVEKHRMISTNSSSSRAIPFSRASLGEVFLPEDIRKNEKGMQGYDSLDEIDTLTFQTITMEMYDYVSERLSVLWKMFTPHKQHLNRYLEPWTVQKKIWTANEEWFEYFFSLRSAKDADPNIQDLSKKIEIALNSAKPKNYREWHIPYITQAEWELYYKNKKTLEELLIHSVARCARVSYNNFDGSLSTIDQDQRLFDFLKESRHMTPFEHQAQLFLDNKVSENNATLYGLKEYLENTGQKGITHIDLDGYFHSGNFKGFAQLRQML